LVVASAVSLSDPPSLHVAPSKSKHVIGHVITVVKGHGWTYNVKSAWRSVAERWAKEASQWVGSNYHCFSCKITFANNALQC